jgi:dihydrofolate reductase
MMRIRGYIAASLDGYIAAADGGVEWLQEFQQHDFGFENFLEDIGTVILGRATYDQVCSFGVGWPYAGKRAIILTSRPVEGLPEGAEVWNGPVEELAAKLHAEGGGDAWVVGGASVQRAFLDAGALDRIEIFVIPVLLGDGVPLWPKSERGHRLSLTALERLEGGMVRLDYRFDVPSS